MRKSFILFLFCLLTHVFIAQSYKSYELYLGDTINRIDKEELKQGRWIVFGKSIRGLTHQLLKPNSIIEEGKYVNGKKEGVWKSYHIQTNKLKSELTYKNDITNGLAKFYTEDGKIKEEGVLLANLWQGYYSIYDEKGIKIIRKAWDKNTTRKACLLFKATLVNKGEALNKARVVVRNNELEVLSEETDKTGEFEIPLELHKEYKISFEKPGYSHAPVEINTYVTSITDSTIYRYNHGNIEMYDNITTANTKEVIGFLLNKPSDRIYYHQKEKMFLADRAYSNVFKKQVKGISETAKILLISAAEDNKRLEIENLRIEAENKKKEIQLLKNEHELQKALLENQEKVLLEQEFKTERQRNSLLVLERDRQEKQLRFEKQQALLVKQQLEAERKAHELSELNIKQKWQEVELKNKEESIEKASLEIGRKNKEAELKEKEIYLLNKEKEQQEKVLKEKQKTIFISFIGLIIIGIVSFFLFRNNAQKRKANAILEKQAVEISKQKDEIEQKGRIIEEKNRETGQSIEYAKRIQEAILPPINEIKEVFPQSFILHKPKDIVSGDFYFFEKALNKIKGQELMTERSIIAAVDCTGHGVPGAIMSMIGAEKLQASIKKTVEPAVILQLLNNGIKTALRQSLSNDSTRDGMDIALCAFDFENKKLKYAGSNRPLWILRHNIAEIEEIKPDKFSIAGYTEYNQVFQQHELDYAPGDTFYLFTDGFSDQFGGDKGKKLLTKKFKEVLAQIRELTLFEQKKYLEEFIETWRNDCEQTDDILVIGIRV